MGFLGKFTNAIRNGVQGITNKVSGAWNSMKDTVSNAWENTKGVAGQVWEGVKDAAVKTGQFIYNNSDAIAAGLGGAAMGAAGYFGGPGAASFLRESLIGASNFIPEGKVKDALLNAAWAKDRNNPKPSKVDLDEENPGGANYAGNVSGNKPGGFNYAGNFSGNKPSLAIGYDSNTATTGKYNQRIPTPTISAPMIYESENVKKPSLKVGYDSDTAISKNYTQKILTPTISAPTIHESGYDPLFIQNTSSSVVPLHPVYTGKYTHKKTGRRKIKPPTKNRSKTGPKRKFK